MENGRRSDWFSHIATTMPPPKPVSLPTTLIYRGSVLGVGMATGRPESRSLDTTDLRLDPRESFMMPSLGLRLSLDLQIHLETAAESE